MKRINQVSKLKLVEFLNRVALFKDLTPKERQDVANLPNLVVLLAEDEVFIRKGEYGSSFYILLNGEVKVTMKDKHVANVGPGHFIGEVGFICNEPRSATVTTVKDSIALRITRDLFDKLPIKVREGIKNKIISGLVDRVVSQNGKIVDMEEEIDILNQQVEFYRDDKDSDEKPSKDRNQRKAHALDIEKR